MSVRTNLIDWKVINSDTHFSKYLETLSEAGVGEWMEVTSGQVSPWYCRVPCIRTNEEEFYALVTNTDEFSIETSWTWYIIVSIPQEAIDDWSILNEDWTAIATISFVESLPTKNYLLLATITSWTIEDSRNIIPKITELWEDVVELQATAEDLDERVEALEESWAVDHLEEMALVWEKYTLSDTLFKQITPALDDSTVESNVWDVAANTEIHIQRMWSGVASNQLKLKVKMNWSPTTSLVAEVRKWIKVDVSSTEAYWYWDSSNIIATWTLAYSSFSTSWQEVTFNLDNEFWATEWELLDVVVYQTAWSGAIVNASNFYIIACDSTQWSEWFSFVSVNWTTRTRSKLMPYCVSDWFAQSLLCKVSEATINIFSNVSVYSGNTTRNASEWSTILLYYKRLTIPFTSYPYKVEYTIARTNNIQAISGYSDSDSWVIIKWPWIWVAINWVMDDTKLTKWWDNVAHTDSVSYTFTTNAPNTNVALWLTNWETGSFSWKVWLTNLSAKASYDMPKSSGSICWKVLNNALKWIGNKVNFVFLGQYAHNQYLTSIVSS